MLSSSGMQSRLIYGYLLCIRTPRTVSLKRKGVGIIRSLRHSFMSDFTVKPSFGKDHLGKKKELSKKPISSPQFLQSIFIKKCSEVVK